MQDRLKAIRKETGLTQEQFAESIGASRNMVAQAETGLRQHGKHAISKICFKYNINEHWLYTGEGEMHNDTKTQAELFEWLGATMATDPFKAKFLQVLSQLKPEAWAAIETLVNALLEQQEESEGK